VGNRLQELAKDSLKLALSQKQKGLQFLESLSITESG
jgi:hypothetical protein